jgi:glycosyltransferase involved in cell wall biosynthesis
MVMYFYHVLEAEGWNLPLIEAMACGTPSIYSACSGQMEFAKNKGLPVKVLGEKSTHQ